MIMAWKKDCTLPRSQHSSNWSANSVPSLSERMVAEQEIDKSHPLMSTDEELICRPRVEGLTHPERQPGSSGHCTSGYTG